MADVGADPVFDRGMTARSNRLPRSANPEKPGTPARTAWDKGWLTGEVGAVEIVEADEPVETPTEAV